MKYGYKCKVTSYCKTNESSVIFSNKFLHRKWNMSNKLERWWNKFACVAQMSNIIEQYFECIKNAVNGGNCILDLITLKEKWFQESYNKY